MLEPSSAQRHEAWWWRVLLCRCCLWRWQHDHQCNKTKIQKESLLLLLFLEECDLRDLFHSMRVQKKKKKKIHTNKHECPTEVKLHLGPVKNWNMKHKREQQGKILADLDFSRYRVNCQSCFCSKVVNCFFYINDIWCQRSLSPCAVSHFWTLSFAMILMIYQYYVELLPSAVWSSGVQLWRSLLFSNGLDFLTVSHAFCITSEFGIRGNVSN